MLILWRLNAYHVLPLVISSQLRILCVMYECPTLISQAVNSVECVLSCVVQYWMLAPVTRWDTHTHTCRDKSAVCLQWAGHWSSAAVFNGMENGWGADCHYESYCFMCITQSKYAHKNSAKYLLHENMSANRYMVIRCACLDACKNKMR